VEVGAPLWRRVIIAVLGLIAILSAYTGFVVWRLASTRMRAQERYEARDYPGAVLAFKECVSLDPEAADAHYWLANALEFSGHIPEAIVEFRRAVELEPKIVDYRMGLGSALGSAGQHLEAIRVYEQAVALQPNNADLLVLLGHARYEVGRQQEAVDAFYRALQAQPGHRAAQMALDRIQR
jgi:tetratricopeptide (TPR) repeat protein